MHDCTQFNARQILEAHVLRLDWGILPHNKWLPPLRSGKNFQPTP